MSRVTSKLQVTLPKVVAGSNVTSEPGTIPHCSAMSLQEKLALFATTRRRVGRPPLLAVSDALREAKELLTIFPVLWPEENQLRLAMRGMAACQLGWFDALLWATAEHHGIGLLYSEDFQHGRLYGRVRAVDPFRA